MEIFDFSTIFFIIVAGLIFYQLRSVLGKRTGNERHPINPYGVKDNESKQESNVVTLRRSDDEDESEDDRIVKEIDAIAKPDTQLNKNLRAIRNNDANFAPKTFLDGAKMAYEMIVMSFADGDRKTLRNLLSSDVYDNFDAAITQREQRNEKIQSSFVGINNAKIIDAQLRDNVSYVSVRIVSEMISATVNEAGDVIDGNPDAVTEGTEIWTFARDTQSRDPNWKLDATEEE